MYSSCRITTHFNLREHINVHNDDNVDLKPRIGYLSDKEQYLLYNGVSINIPRHYIVSHIAFYTELQQPLDTNSSLDVAKSASQFVSRYDFKFIDEHHWIFVLLNYSGLPIVEGHQTLFSNISVTMILLQSCQYSIANTFTQPMVVKME